MREYLIDGILIVQLPFQIPVYNERNKACDKVSKDPVLTIKVHGPCLKIRFHYPEAFLDFPPVLVRFDDAVYIIVKICTDRIETIIFLLVLS